MSDDSLLHSLAARNPVQGAMQHSASRRRFLQAAAAPQLHRWVHSHNPPDRSRC